MSDDERNRHIERASHRLEEMSTLLTNRSTGELSTDDWILTRAQIGFLMADFNDSLLAVDRLHETGGAAQKILRFFQLRLGVKVSKEEISGVAGIHAWARRVRELRQDLGWDIQSATTGSGLRPGEYMLRQGSPDPDLSASWTAAREMRKLRTAGGLATPKVRTLRFLQEIFPRYGDVEQLVHVAGSREKSALALTALVDDGWLIDENDDGVRLRSTERS